MARAKRINAMFTADVIEDLEALQKHYCGIPLSSIVLIAVKRLAQAELPQKQTASPDSIEEAV
jgi:hypothetical protein